MFKVYILFPVEMAFVSNFQLPFWNEQLNEIGDYFIFSDHKSVISQFSYHFQWDLVDFFYPSLNPEAPAATIGVTWP